MDWGKFLDVTTDPEQREVLEMLKDTKGMLEDQDAETTQIALGVVLREALLSMAEGPGSSRRANADNVVQILASYVLAVIETASVDEEGLEEGDEPEDDEEDDDDEDEDKEVHP